MLSFVLVVTVAPFALAQGPLFPAPQSAATPASGGSVVADFDGDGFSDVALSDGGQHVRVCYGDGQGAFEHARTISSGVNAFGLHAGDFTDDGKPDLLLCIAAKLRVLPSLGSAGFGAPIDTAAPPFPAVYATADLDHDGHVDLLAPFGASIQFHRGLGTGSFAAPQPTALSSFASALELGDADHDGDLDAWLLAAGVSGEQRVGLSLGNGDGTFHAASWLAIPDYAMAIRAGDWNGDGFCDAAVVLRDASTEPGSLLFFESHGDGTFAWNAMLPTGPEPFTLETADLDGDGDLDLAATLWGVTGVRELDVFLGRGDGNFTAQRRTFIGPMSKSLAFGRLDADAHPDAILVSDSITALRGRGDGGFEAPFALDSGEYVRSATVADVVGNALPDVVVVAPTSARLDLFENVGAGRFGAGQGVAFPGPTYVARCADLDHDAHVDLVALIAQSGVLHLSTRLADGAGGFQPATVGSPLRATYDPELVDLDADGELDAVTSHRGHFAIQLGFGDGTFGTPLEHAAPFGPLELAIVDVTEDGVPDLLSVDDRNSRVALVQGLGGLQFGAPRVFSVLPTPTALAVADFDLDGHLDLAVLSSAKPSFITLCSGDGHGSFTIGAPLVCDANASALVSADFDDDGRPDLMHTNGLGAGVSLIRNLGQGQYSDAVRHATGEYPGFVLASDLDLDGRTDALAGGGYLTGVAVLMRL